MSGGTGTKRVIVLIDMDCFYCQVEEKLDPKLRDQPMAVVQYNAWRGGGIIAVNYPARDQGVTRHMRGNDALKKCPTIRLVRVPEVRGKADLTKYRDAGKKVAQVLQTFTPLLERASVDEAYLDITEAVTKRIDNGLDDLKVDNMKNTFVIGSDTLNFISAVKAHREFSESNLKLAVGGLIVEEIRSEVYKKTGYKCSAGIAHNKILAKLVCAMHKPNKQTILPHEAVEEFFKETPVKKIKSLGGKFGETLSEELGITYMAELMQFSQTSLVQKFDEKTGTWLYNLARGINMEPVTTKLIPKSIGCCKNFFGRSALISADMVEHWLSELADEMQERLENDLEENGRKAKQMTVSFTQEINKKDISGTRTHVLSSYDKKKIAQGAFEVLKKFCLKPDGTYHLKFLGLSAGHFDNIKNLREITSFFKIKEDPKISSEISCPSHSLSMKANSPVAPCENDSLLYSVLTQETDEPDNLVYYQPEETVIATADDHKPTCSFFSDYFNPDDVSTDENSKICPKCNKSIPLADFISHQDYHLALKLANEAEIEFKTDEATTGRSQPVKTFKGQKSRDNDNQTLLSFIQRGNDLDATETCSECKKRLRVDEVGSHMDYHQAKRLHLELNNIKLPSQIHNCKRNKKKSGATLISYFKPSQ